MVNLCQLINNACGHLDVESRSFVRNPKEKCERGQKEFQIVILRETFVRQREVNGKSLDNKKYKYFSPFLFSKFNLCFYMLQEDTNTGTRVSPGSRD